MIQNLQKDMEEFEGIRSFGWNLNSRLFRIGFIIDSSDEQDLANGNWLEMVGNGEIPKEWFNEEMEYPNMLYFANQFRLIADLFSWIQLNATNLNEVNVVRDYNTNENEFSVNIDIPSRFLKLE